MRNHHEITIDPARCVGCGLCRDDCPASNLVVEGKKAAPLTQTCLMCAHCVAICPTNAVSISGFDEDPRPLDGTEALEPGRLLAALRARRSMRRFADRPVSDEALAAIVEAGRLTPTGKNAQDVSFIVLRERLARCEELAVRYSGFFVMAVNLSPALRRELCLKRGEKAVAALVVGHPAVTYRRTAPKEPADVRFL